MWKVNFSPNFEKVQLWNYELFETAIKKKNDKTFYKKKSGNVREKKIRKMHFSVNKKVFLNVKIKIASFFFNDYLR